ncbi:MAG: hypothetical protein ACO1SV_27745 [Fimbriimonas sp.]
MDNMQLETVRSEANPPRNPAVVLLTELVTELGKSLLASAFEKLWKDIAGSEFDDLAKQFEAMTANSINETLKRQAAAKVSESQAYLLKYTNSHSEAALEQAENSALAALTLIEQTGAQGTGLYTLYLIYYFSLLDRQITLADDKTAQDLRAYRDNYAKVTLSILLTNYQATLDLRKAMVTPVLASMELVDPETWAYRTVYSYTDNGVEPPFQKKFDDRRKSSNELREEAQKDRAAYLSTLDNEFAFINNSVPAIRGQERFFNDGDIVQIVFRSSVGNCYLTACNYTKDGLYDARFQSVGPYEGLTQFRISIDGAVTRLIFDSSFGPIYLTACNYNEATYYDARFQCLNSPCDAFCDFNVDIDPDDRAIHIVFPSSFGPIYLAACNYEPTINYDARFHCLGQPCGAWSDFHVQFVSVAPHTNEVSLRRNVAAPI